MKRDAQINFRTSSEIKQQVEEIALRQGIKPSELINKIVSEFLTCQKKGDSAPVDIHTVYEMVTSLQKRTEILEKKSAA